MSVTIPAKAFDAALGRVVATVERRNTNPILQCVYLAAGGGELTIEGTDLDVLITTRVPVAGELPPTLIEADRLATISSRLKDRAEITLERDGPFKATIASGRSRFSLATMDSGTWGRLSRRQGENPTSFTTTGATFARLMTALAPAICDEETRYYLCGIALAGGTVADPKAREGGLTAVATNGHILYARSIAIEGELTVLTRPAVVPAKTCALLAKLFPGKDEITVTLSDEKITVEDEHTTLLSKLVDGQFPDWRRLVPKTPPGVAYDAQQLLAAVETAVAATRDGKDGKAVKLGFADAETVVSATDVSNPDFSGMEVAPHTGLEGPKPAAIGVSARYLSQMLDSLDAETAELAPGDGSGPMQLRGAALDDRVIMIMPMRV